MKKVFQCICLLILPLLALAEEPLTYCESFGSGNTDNKTSNWILYGHRNDKIVFVIFQNNQGTNTSSQHIHLTLSSTNAAPGLPKKTVGKGWIDMPDGTKRDLPTSNMVFEYTDGVFHSAPIDMSQDDLWDFIDSRKTKRSGFQGLTVDNLKKFKKQRKTKSTLKKLDA